MGATITITRVDDQTLTVHFSEPIKMPAGEEVPVSFLQSVLDYYTKHADPKTGLTHHGPPRPW